MNDYTMNSKNFYKALEQGALIGSQCQDCSTYILPQRRICPECHAENTEITAYDGRGRLAAYTVVFVPPVSMAKEGYSAKNPYCVGIVELLEGPRVSAQIIDIDINQPENIKIGTPLKMTTVKRGEGEDQAAFLAFKPE